MNEEYKAIILAALDENDSMVNAGQEAFLLAELRSAREELRSNTGLLLNASTANLDSATLSVQLAVDKINWLIRCLGSL
mgnify:FL=1